MKPPPPTLPASGQVTARANAVATAASTALPPFFRMTTPTSDAGPDTDTTMPLRPSAEWPSARPRPAAGPATARTPAPRRSSGPAVGPNDTVGDFTVNLPGKGAVRLAQLLDRLAAGPDGDGPAVVV